jgi:hypothetical protein
MLMKAAGKAWSGAILTRSGIVLGQCAREEVEELDSFPQAYLGSCASRQ